jgi:hypothetical protein
MKNVCVTRPTDLVPQLAGDNDHLGTELSAVLPGAGGRKASFFVNHRVPESQVPDLINPTSGRYEDSIIQDLIPTIENTILKGRVRQ